MSTSTIQSTAEALVAPGKGILAADESFPTIEKRFKAFNIPSTEENRRAYRGTLFTTPQLNQFISGVILFDETLRQKTKEGVSFPEFLSEQGIIPGIKVDKGTENLANFQKEKITRGLDGLRERLAEYRELGARFTKWRAVIRIRESIPSSTCIAANARMLACFAALSQEAGLVPIVEPEVLMDGDHTIKRCEEVSNATLKRVFELLFDHRVVLEGMLLKASMVLPGADCPAQVDVAGVASATLRSLQRSVPAAVPGIVLLSGGQSDEAATERLNAICRANEGPWKLSFSFGRALQAPALKSWNGSSENNNQAQAALLRRAKFNGLAVQGKFSPEMEAITALA